jgi:hypothetical protein
MILHVWLRRQPPDDSSAPRYCKQSSSAQVKHCTTHFAGYLQGSSGCRPSVVAACPYSLVGALAVCGCAHCLYMAISMARRLVQFTIITNHPCQLEPSTDEYPLLLYARSLDLSRVVSQEGVHFWRFALISFVNLLDLACNRHTLTCGPLLEVLICPGQIA